MIAIQKRHNICQDLQSWPTRSGAGCLCETHHGFWRTATPAIRAKSNASRVMTRAPICPMTHADRVGDPCRGGSAPTCAASPIHPEASLSHLRSFSDPPPEVDARTQKLGNRSLTHRVSISQARFAKPRASDSEIQRSGVHASEVDFRPQQIKFSPPQVDFPL
jgi:hypothetical protein